MTFPASETRLLAALALAAALPILAGAVLLVTTPAPSVSISSATLH